MGGQETGYFANLQVQMFLFALDVFEGDYEVEKEAKVTCVV